MKKHPILNLQGPAVIELVDQAPKDPLACAESMDDVRAVLDCICDALENIEGVRFSVQAFDRVAWPVSVSVDLSVVLEQLPDVCAAAHEGRSFEIDFFEQGIERTLHFQARGKNFDISCTSRLASWSPQWGVESVAQVEVRSMLQALVGEFVRLATAVRPELVTHPQFMQWARGASLVG